MLYAFFALHGNQIAAWTAGVAVTLLSIAAARIAVWPWLRWSA